MHSANSRKVKTNGLSFTGSQVIFFLVIANGSFVLGILLGYGIGLQVKEYMSSTDTKQIVPFEKPKNTTDGLFEKSISVFMSAWLFSSREAMWELCSITLSNSDSFIPQMVFPRLPGFSIRVYHVLRSYPNISHPNAVILRSSDGEELYNSAIFKNVSSREYLRRILPPYCSFAPAGNVTGQMVYMNYGRLEDINLLMNKFSVSLQDRIVITRLGKIPSRKKVLNAERYNATGVILYSDPADINDNNTNITYPDSWWLPRVAVKQTSLGVGGDLLTPLYPAAEYANRQQRSDIIMPKIPVQSISYGDAFEFLNALSGSPAPDAWQGALPMQYRLGPILVDDKKVQLTVNNEEAIKEIQNLITYIHGIREPDRYIIIAGQNTPWTLGASSISGIAVLDNLIHTVDEMAATYGRKPKRTIAFCFWGGTNEDLLGSTEFVEEYSVGTDLQATGKLFHVRRENGKKERFVLEHMKILHERAVVYLNINLACEYNYILTAKVSPLLQDFLYDVAKKVENPDRRSKFKTIYDVWKHRDDHNTLDTDQEPRVSHDLGSESNTQPFLTRIGIPTLDVWYTFDKNKWDIPHIPTYNTIYNTYDIYKNHIDPDFLCMDAMTVLWKHILWTLADRDILPFDVRRYASMISNAVDSMKTDYGEIWDSHSVKIDALDSAVSNLTASTMKFHEEISETKPRSELEHRIINDKLMKFERIFIDPEGLPGRRMYKHIIFSPSKYPANSGKPFPGIVDAMFEIQQIGEDRWDLLEQEIFIATFFIQTAAKMLTDA